MFMPKPEAIMKSRYWLPGFGFADVDGAFERAIEGRRADREGADLGVVGAFGRAFGAEVGLGFGAARSGRRRHRG